MKTMVFITGDVHHLDFTRRLRYGKLKVPENYELKASSEFIKVLSEYEVPCTLFITGKLLDSFPELSTLLFKNVEIGGHTYYTFRGPLYGYTLLRPIYKKMFGTYYGPKLLIRHDVFKTMHAFQKLNLKPIAWRTHGYEGNEYLYSLLAKLGFKIVSDCRSDTFKLFKCCRILHVCINMPTDEDLPTKSLTERLRWYEKYLRLLSMKAIREKALVLQLHPANMALDNFYFLAKIIKLLLKSNARFHKISFFVRQWY
jgi:peptidoglycan/xylan/chitin deacetylase (PgdA/CDA1 family)